MAKCEEEKMTSLLSGKRGVGSFEYNGSTIFVKEHVEAVSHSLSNKRHANCWQKNVICQEIELTEQCFFVFRFKGHSWTNVIARDPSGLDFVTTKETNQINEEILKQEMEKVYSLCLNEEDAYLLSMDLKTRTIFYGVSDTILSLGYRIYENGELLEKFETDEGYEILEWESNIHDDRIDIKAEEWVDQLFRQQDIFEPSINFRRWVGYAMHKPGDKITLSDPKGYLERVDFVAL